MELPLLLVSPHVPIESLTQRTSQRLKDLTIAIEDAAASVSGAGIASITAGIQTSPTITPFTLPNGTVNVAYPTIQLEATGGIPPYTWSVSPALPNGLIINLLGPGIISGTPLNASNGPATYTFTVTDSSVPTGQSSKLTRNLTVNAALTIDMGSTNRSLTSCWDRRPTIQHTDCRPQGQQAQEPIHGRLLEILPRLQVSNR